MKSIKLFALAILGIFALFVSSCSSDDDLNKEPPAEEYVTKAKDILNGDIVLSTKATMSGVDKTHLASGCPTKFNFTWKDGNVTTNGDDPNDCQTGSGASVDGYLNVLTNQIEFIVNYNMMNVRTETFQQTIDKSRLNNFKAEFEQYEKDLAQWKKDHGQG